MRLSVSALAVLTVGCASQSVPVQRCVRDLPPDDYSVVEVATIRNEGLLLLAQADLANGERISIPDYNIHWPTRLGWGQPTATVFVLLERKPDKLVMCQVSFSNCSPNITWLLGDSQTGTHRRWTVESYMPGICVTANKAKQDAHAALAPHNKSLERTRDR
jgi:hypothetical protein